MSRERNNRAKSIAAAIAAGVALSACGGGGGGSSQPPPPPAALTYTVGGTVSGLAGSGLTIRNGTVDLPVAAAGNFAFTTQLASGTAYAVSVVTQPSTPAQTCAVANGSGTIGSANVSNVSITCTTTALSLASSTPVNNATGIDRGGNLALVFSAPLDPASVAGNVTLQNASGQITIAASVSGSTLTVDPQINLAILANYTLTVATGLRGSAGEPLAAAVTVQFRTADGNWQMSRLLETNNAGAAVAPRVSMNANGSGVAVWQQSDGARTNIWSSRFTPGADWTAAELIESSMNSGEAPDVAVDAEGNTIAVWAQFDGLRRISANRYTPATGWGTAQTLQPAGIVLGNSLFPKVAVDGAGNAMAVWWALDDPDIQSAFTSIWSNRYTRSGGWGTEELASASLFNSVGPQVAMDTAGNAFAVWDATIDFNGTPGIVYANRATPATGWGAHERIDAAATAGSAVPQIAVDGSGNAIAVWQRMEAGIGSIWSARFETDGGWGVGQLIETNTTDSALAPQIAVMPNGEAFAIWHQADGTRFNIWTNRYTRAGWGTPELIETNNAGGAQDAQIAVDPSGRALAVWKQFDGTRFNIWSNRFLPGSGWGTPVLLEIANDGEAGAVRIAMDANGAAIAVWHQSDGTRFNIHAARFE